MMKKLALALITSTAVMVSATQANIGTGYYVGVHTGYGATTAKMSGVATGLNNSGPAGQSIPESIEMGSTAPNLGIMAGYGWVTGCMYYGGEFAYTFEPVKITDTEGQNAITDKLVFKRNGYVHAGLRGGYLFTPNTMFYLRLGANFGQWSINDSLDNGFISAFAATGRKSRFTVTPGLGIETAIHQHVYLRVEYVFEWGPATSASNSNLLGSTKMDNVRTQAGKVGLSYKF